MTNPRKALVYALMDLSRYEITQYGHRDARENIANAIEAMIDQKIAAALKPKEEGKQ